MRAYILRVLVALDMFFNVIFFGNVDQTISSRAALAWRKNVKWGCVLCKLLDWLQKDHCLNAVTHDLARAELIVEIEAAKERIREQILRDKRIENGS